SGTAVSADIVGLWAYSHTNQENESGTEVSITISEFQYAPPHMEISADGGATIYFYESRIRGTLALTAPDTYALLNSVSESEGFEYDDDIDDYLRYDPESGLLQYVTVVGGVHHYFRQNLTP
ncbi:MAG: hypothetical protein FWH49_06545, partial [Clostridiales bacterium]|nr:hypothetical protein [Clostridiales bacterium]